MEIAEVYMQNHNSGYYNDSIRDSAVQWALDKHNLSKTDFDSTLTWYGRNIDEYRDLYARVDQELSRRQEKITGEKEQPLTSSDLWPYSRHVFVSDKGATNGLYFSIEGNDVNKGDRLTWEMRLNGLSAGDIMLGVDYDDGSASYSHRKQNNNKKIELSLQTDTASAVKRIFGYIRINGTHSLPVWIDSIALKGIPLDTTQYYRVFSQKKYHGPSKRIEKKDESILLIEEDSKIGDILNEDSSLEKPAGGRIERRKKLLKNVNQPMSGQPVSLSDKPVKAIPEK